MDYKHQPVLVRKITKFMQHELIQHEYGIWEDHKCPSKVPSKDPELWHLVPLFERSETTLIMYSKAEVEVVLSSLSNTIDKVEGWADGWNDGETTRWRNHLRGLCNLQDDLNRFLTEGASK